MKGKTVVRNYRGSHEKATELFKKDAKIAQKDGYYPISQNYSPGAYGCGSFLVAALLCVVLIGIIVFIYMLIVKPEGTLTVTYELKEIDTGTSEEKTCPKCAESVKFAAKICRFCNHQFQTEEI